MTRLAAGAGSRPQAAGSEVRWRDITPDSARHGVGIREILKHRDLLLLLVRRNIVSRYRQAVLGVLWVLIQPLMTTLVFSLLLGRWLGGTVEGVPYPVFALLGLLPWGLFAGTLGTAMSSLSGSAYLMTHIYFPRAVLPLGASLACFVDFGIAAALLFGAMLWYGVWPAWSAIFCLPLAVWIGFVGTALGMGLGALDIRWRDIGHAVPFAVQLWMFATPIVYPRHVVDARWRFALDLNPLAAPIDAFRGCLLGRPIEGGALALSAAIGLVLSAAGIHLFRRTERQFADFV